MPTTSTPSYLPEVMGQWQIQLQTLQMKNKQAEEKLTQILEMGLGNSSRESQLIQAQLDQLKAAQNYNALLESGSQIIRVAQDAESRLNGTNLSLLERNQLETSRDQLYSLAGEFISFKTAQQLQVMHVAPVESGGKTYYIDGRAEWNSHTPAGLLGQFMDGAREIAAGVKEALLKGPFTSAQELHIERGAA